MWHYYSRRGPREHLVSLPPRSKTCAGNLLYLRCKHILKCPFTLSSFLLQKIRKTWALSASFLSTNYELFGEEAPKTGLDRVTLRILGVFNSNKRITVFHLKFHSDHPLIYCKSLYAVFSQKSVVFQNRVSADWQELIPNPPLNCVSLE